MQQTTKPASNEVLVKLAADASGKSEVAIRAVGKLIDYCVGNNIPVMFFQSPDKVTDASPTHRQFYADLRTGAVAGFTAGERRALTLPIDTMSQSEKKLRKTTQTKIGAKIGDWKKAYTKRLERDAAGEDSENENEPKGEGKKTAASVDAKLQSTLAGWITRLESESGESVGFNIPAMIAKLKAAMALIK